MRVIIGRHFSAYARHVRAQAADYIRADCRTALDLIFLSQAWRKFASQKYLPRFIAGSTDKQPGHALAGRELFDGSHMMILRAATVAVTSHASRQ